MIATGSRRIVVNTNFTSEQSSSALAKLHSMPEAPEGYRHFDPGFQQSGGPSQIRMKEFGLKGAGTIFGNRKEKEPSVEMHLDPKDVHYAQIAVTRHGVAEKLSGKWDNPEFGAKGLPDVVKRGDEFHLQGGFHRAAAQVLATGKIRAKVTEYIPPTSKRGKGKYVKPEIPIDTSSSAG
jgi:hypothetical protein